MEVAIMVNVGILGATGYVGIEIVRLLHKHPGVNISLVVSQSFAGQKISDVYPSLKKVFEMECQGLDIDKIVDYADIFITALPHGISKQIIPNLVESRKRVIDHSADFRYKSVEIYEQWTISSMKCPICWVFQFMAFRSCTALK